MNRVSIIKNSSLFDWKWYKAKYDIADNDSLSVARYFLESGWEKSQDPSPFFSVDSYLDFYPDVKKAKINPLMHYELFGRNEGRKIFSIVNLY